MGMTSSKGSKTKAALRATSPGAGSKLSGTSPAHPKKREETAKTEEALTRMYHTLDPTAAKRQEYFAAKLEEWSNAYEQWQERAKALGVDKEHDEETREELMQRRDADGVAGADIRLDTKRAHDDTTNSESAPPAKKAKGPPPTPPEEEVKDPTLQQIFESFHAHDRNKGRNLEWLEALESNCQNYGWNGSDKSYVMSEYNQERFGSSFLKLHGAERLCDNIDHFLSYFVPRKMMTPDFKDMKRCAATLRALVKFCISRGYLEKDDIYVKYTLESISVSGNFDAEGIRRSLQQLKDTGYWKRLRAEREDDGETDHEAEDVTMTRDDDPVEEGDDFGIGDSSSAECASVHKNGWVFTESFGFDKRRVLIYLPPEVAKLGRVDMQLSCMDFVYLGRGVWEPMGKWDEGDVCANVYPP